MELRAGLVGLGMMGKNHARVMGSTENVELVGIADPLGDPTGTINSELIFSSLEELIDEDYSSTREDEMEQEVFQMLDEVKRLNGTKPHGTKDD